MTYTSKEEPPDKPLKSKSYYLDLRSPTVNINQLKKDIVVLGGQVEKFLSKQINYVITDCYNAEDNLISRVNNFTSPEILSADKKVRIPNIKLPLSRGQTLLLKSIRRNVEGSSNVLTNARLWGIKVINQSEFLLQLDKLKAEYKLSQRKSKQYNSLVRPLRGSFIKFEDVPRKFKVHYKQFLSFPALTITNGYLGSPFDEIQNISNCEINLTRLKQDSKNFNNKPLGKTRTHNYCECCKLYYANMEVHLKSQEHQRFANNERNYENVQSLIASLETLDALIAKIKPEKEEQEASRSRQIITNNEANESQAGSESQNKGTPACAASGDSYPKPKLISNACIIAQSGTDGDVIQTKNCNTEKQVLEQEPCEINRDKFTLETEPDRLNPHLDSKSSMSDTILKTTPNDGKYEIAAASTLPPKKRILTSKPRPSITDNEIILPLKNVAQETGCDLHKKQQKTDNASNVNALPQSKLDLSGMNGAESNETESQAVDTVHKRNNASASETQPFCANNQNNGHESDFDWDFDVEVDARHSEGPGNVPTLDFCSSNNDDNIDNEGWEIFKESILENAVHNVVPELSDLDICLPESETDVKCESEKISANCEDLQKTELKTGTAWCTFSASESSEILELKNIETICKKLEAESQSVDVERKGGDDFHETDSEMEFVQEPEQDVIVDNRKAGVNDSKCFIPIIKKLQHLPERPHSCPVDATQRTPLEENRPSSCPAEEELTASSAGSTPNGDLEIEIVRSGKLPVRFRSRESCRSQELDKASLSPNYDGDKLIESFITDNDDSDQQKLMITLKCKNHYWSATESLSPWRVQNSGDLKLQFKRSELDQTEVKNENNVEWRVRTSGDCKLTLYTMKRKGYSKKENINVFYPKCKKRKLNL